MVIEKDYILSGFWDFFKRGIVTWCNSIWEKLQKKKSQRPFLCEYV